MHACTHTHTHPAGGLCSSPALQSWFCRAGRARGSCQEWGHPFQPPGLPFSWVPVTRGAPRESDVQVAPRGWRRPGAIVCGRADRSGAPLGQISLPKSLQHASWRDARVDRDGCPRRRRGAAVHGGLGLSIRGAPHGLWVTGSRRRRTSKATGIDRTPHSGAGAAFGIRDDPLNFGAAVGVRDPREMRTPLSGLAGRGLAYWQPLGTESPLEKRLGAPQGLQTAFCLGMQKTSSEPPGACRTLEQGRHLPVTQS